LQLGSRATRPSRRWALDFCHLPSPRRSEDRFRTGGLHASLVMTRSRRVGLISRPTRQVVRPRPQGTSVEADPVSHDLLAEGVVAGVLPGLVPLRGRDRLRLVRRNDGVVPPFAGAFGVSARFLRSTDAGRRIRRFAGAPSDFPQVHPEGPPALGAGVALSEHPETFGGGRSGRLGGGTLDSLCDPRVPGRPKTDPGPCCRIVRNLTSSAGIASDPLGTVLQRALREAAAVLSGAVVCSGVADFSVPRDGLLVQSVGSPRPGPRPCRCAPCSACQSPARARSALASGHGSSRRVSPVGPSWAARVPGHDPAHCAGPRPPLVRLPRGVTDASRLDRVSAVVGTPRSPSLLAAALSKCAVDLSPSRLQAVGCGCCQGL